MGIMDNEGHDPMGLGNILSYTDGNDLRRLKAVNERLRAENESLILTLKQPDQVGYWQRRCEIAEDKLRAHEQSAPEGDNDPNGNRHLAREIDGS